MSKLIYIADDEESARELASVFLERDGYSVAAFETGDELLAACEESLPDMVILDIMMPGSDGLSVCSALRQRSKELPIYNNIRTRQLIRPGRRPFTGLR